MTTCTHFVPVSCVKLPTFRDAAVHALPKLHGTATSTTSHSEHDRDTVSIDDSGVCVMHERATRQEIGFYTDTRFSSSLHFGNTPTAAPFPQYKKRQGPVMREGRCSVEKKQDEIEQTKQPLCQASSCLTLTDAPSFTETCRPAHRRDRMTGRHITGKICPDEDKWIRIAETFKAGHRREIGKAQYMEPVCVSTGFGQHKSCYQMWPTCQLARIRVLRTAGGSGSDGRTFLAPEKLNSSPRCFILYIHFEGGAIHGISWVRGIQHMQGVRVDPKTGRVVHLSHAVLPQVKWTPIQHMTYSRCPGVDCYQKTGEGRWGAVYLTRPSYDLWIVPPPSSCTSPVMRIIGLYSI